MPDDPLKSPCVGLCSTIYGDIVCRGCFRHYEDIIHWNTFAPQNKLPILSQLNTLITRILQESIEITDAALLEKKCLQHHVKIRKEWSPYTWAHSLLRAGIGKIKTPKKFGFFILPHLQNLSTAALIEHLDDLIFAQQEKDLTYE